jgi:hypothetical protein
VRLLREYQAECEDINQRNGWNTPQELLNPCQIEAKRMLIITELAEAAEDVRLGDLTTYHEGTKPCGFPIELADTVIRCLDSLTCSGVAEAPEFYRADLPGVLLSAEPGAQEILAVLYRLTQQPPELIIHDCFSLALALGIDLDTAIEAKIAYNRHRPPRHGGKLA